MSFKGTDRTEVGTFIFSSMIMMIVDLPMATLAYGLTSIYIYIYKKLHVYIVYKVIIV